MSKPLRGLGGGAAVLFSQQPKSSKATTANAGDKNMFVCPIEKIVPQKGQPRQHFPKLDELAESIRAYGLLEPLVVRRIGNDKFELIAGERRWRASQKAGLLEVPVVVKDVTPEHAFELAILENEQREDLNPVERAEGYERLLKEHGYTQERLAQTVGKDRTTITNYLRLLKLPVRVRQKVIVGELSEGHARALLGAPSNDKLNELAERVIRGRLSVRATEALVRKTKDGASGKPAAGKPAVKAKSAAVRDVEARLMRRLGAKCEVLDQGGKGQIVIPYSSLDQFDRILAKIGA